MIRNEDILDTREDWQPPPQPRFWPFLKRCGLGRLLLASLPALVAGIAVLVLAGAAATTDPTRLRTHYFEQGVRHFQASEYEAARLGFERILGLYGSRDDREVQYNLGVCLAALGKLDRAVALIEPMAPDDRPGYAPAHLWKARRRWIGSGSKPTPADVRAGEQQLLLAHHLDPNLGEVNALLGMFYLTNGKLDRAVAFLEKGARDRPELLLPLARASLSRSDGTSARHHAREARRIFQERAEANLDDHAARLRWADAETILEEFPAAVAVLQREVFLKSNGRYPQALAQVYLAWYDFLARTEPAKLEARLALLERGLTHDPTNLGLLVRFSDQIRAGGADGDRARAALLDLQARGLALGPVRYILGVDAWLHGRPAEARLHWEEAYRLMPEMPVLANNVAWLLASGATPDLQRALDTINPVVQRWPNERRYRETRGEILLKMQRWKEALPDLEAALPVKSDSSKLHQMLAETYEHLDAPGLAAEHRKRAGPQPMPLPAQPAEPRASTTP